MQRARKSTVWLGLAVIAAVVLRQIGLRTDGHLGWSCELLRSAIYIGLFSLWGVSLRRRILQPQVRCYLTVIAALMVFWVTVRTIRFMFAKAPSTLRYLWYMYYFPMLFIPLLAVFVALSLGKPESFCLPKWTMLLYIPTAALFLMVLTNDLHQLVFAFPPDALVWGNDYSYAIGYFLVVGWQVLCALTALSTMLIKCRIPNSRKVFMQPFVPVILALIYSVLYIFCMPLLRLLAGDMTVVFCLLFAAAFESCIQCGLIQSNTHYEELLACSTLCVQITDPGYKVLLGSPAAPAIPYGAIRQTEVKPAWLDGGMRLSGAPIQGGHVLWMDDVSELLKVLDELREVQENLEDSNCLLQEEYLKVRETRVAEQDRLYNLIQRQTARQINLLVELTDEFDKAVNEDERKKLLGKMIVIGAYVIKGNITQPVSPVATGSDAKRLDVNTIEDSYSGYGTDITEIYADAAAIRDALTDEAKKTIPSIGSNIQYYDLQLQTFADGVWSDKDSESVTILFPYPSGTGSSTTFVVVHMKDDGTLETPAMINGNYGASVTVDSTSPFAIAWRSRSASSAKDDNYEFWDTVEQKIKRADAGDTIKVNAGDCDRMPWTVMQALRQNNVNLVISWNGGQTITIPAGQALADEAGRICYPLSYLAEKYKNSAAITANNMNPETGGVMEIIALVSADINTAVVTPATQGIDEAQAKLEVTPMTPITEAPAITDAPVQQTQTARSSTGILIAVIAAAAALAAGGFLFWRKRKEEM